MQEPDLFPEATGLSPRLAWMQKYDIVTAKNAKGRWYAILTAETLGEGSTEEEALVDLCLSSGIKHWNIEG